MNSLAKPLALACLVAASIGAPAHAKELFVDSKAPNMVRGNPIESDDLIGGYQIYTGDGAWVFDAATINWSNGSADSIPIGQLSMGQWDKGSLLAAQSITANLRANNGAYWSGSPCQGESLGSRVRSRGRYDDCMRIHAISMPVNYVPTTFIHTHTVQSNTGGRYYAASMLINVQRLGFDGTTVADWTPAAVAANPEKAKAIEYITQWAYHYQDAAAAQMDYRRAPDTFAAVPAIRDIFPTDFNARASARTRTTVAQHSTSFTFCEATQTMVREGVESCPGTPSTAPARKAATPVQPQRSVSYVYCEATGRMEVEGSANCQ